MLEPLVCPICFFIFVSCCCDRLTWRPKPLKFFCVCVGPRLGPSRLNPSVTTPIKQQSTIKGRAAALQSLKTITGPAWMPWLRPESSNQRASGGRAVGLTDPPPRGMVFFSWFGRWRHLIRACPPPSPPACAPPAGRTGPVFASRSSPIASTSKCSGAATDETQRPRAEPSSHAFE